MKFLDAVRAVTSPLAAKTFEGSIVQKGWEELRAGISFVTNGGPGTLAPVVRSDEAIKKYRTWIYPIVNLISRKVTTVDYYLYQAQHKKNREKFEKIYQHPMLKLLNAPNRFLSGRQFQEIVQMYLDLCGFACAKIIRKGSGQPGELHIMYPQELVHIELGTTTDNIIKAFWFAPINNRHKIEKIPYRDMLYWHYPHPENPYMPYTPIQALAHVTDIDLYLQVYEKSFFSNNTRPDYVVIPGKSLSRPAAERVVEGLKAKHQGPGKNALPAVLSEDVKIEQLSMSAKDFEFMGLSGWTLDHMCAAFGTPKAMLGLMQDYNRASSIVAETVWVKSCINRRLDLFEDVYNHQLLPNYRNTEGFELEFESALPKDDEWDLAKNTGELNSGLVTIDEIRERNGDAPFDSPLTKVPWIAGKPIPGISKEADQLWTESQTPPPMPGIPGMPGQPGQPTDPNVVSNAPTAQGPMGELGGRPEGTAGLGTLVAATLRNSRPGLSQLLRASRGHRGGLRALIEAHPEMSSIGAMLTGERTDAGLSKLLTRGIQDYILEAYGEEGDELIFKAYEDMRSKKDLIQDEYESEAGLFYIKKGIQIADIVTKQFDQIVIKGGLDFDIDEEDLKGDYKRSVMLYAVKAVNLGFKMGYELVQKAGGKIEEPDLFSEATNNAVGMFLDYSSDLKVKSTKKALIEIIKEGIDKGLDSEAVAENIRDRFKEIGGVRANRIARTEISAAVNAGSDASYEKINEDAGKIVVKETILWTAMDERIPDAQNRVCKVCKEESRHIVKSYETGEVFLVIPIHPNCVCVGRPILA